MIGIAVTTNVKQPHGSFPANPLLAESMYLTGYIERMGTGIPDMINACIEAGLEVPELIQEEEFKTILWRKAKLDGLATPQAAPQVTPQDTPQVTPQATSHVINQDELINRLIRAMTGVKYREELQSSLGLRDRKSFIDNYLSPAIQRGFIEMTLPDTPTSPKQRYRLTEKGKRLQQQLKKQKKK